MLLKLNLVFRGWLYQVPWLYEHNYINKTKFSFYVLNPIPDGGGGGLFGPPVSFFYDNSLTDKYFKLKFTVPS